MIMMKNAPSVNDDDGDDDDDDDDDDDGDDNDHEHEDDGNLERTSAQGGQWTSSPKTIIWYAS